MPLQTRAHIIWGQHARLLELTGASKKPRRHVVVLAAGKNQRPLAKAFAEKLILATDEGVGKLLELDQEGIRAFLAEYMTMQILIPRLRATPGQEFVDSETVFPFEALSEFVLKGK